MGAARPTLSGTGTINAWWWLYTTIITYLGNQFSSAFLVPSGVFVGFSTNFNQFAIRWTWVSTPIPVISPHAAFIHICAILGPTPGNAIKPCKLLGISLLCFSWQITVAFLMYSDFLWRKIYIYYCNTIN